MYKHAAILHESDSQKNYPWYFLILITIAASNFMLIGIYVFFLTAVIYLIFNSNFRITRAILPILWFSIMYFLFTTINDKYSFIFSAKIFVCPLIWLMAYHMSLGKNLDKIFKVILYLAFGLACHGLINFLYNVRSGTNMSLGRTYDFWSQSYSSSTGQAINFTLLIALMFWLIFIQKKRSFCLIGAATYICAMLYNIQLGGRTFLILSVAAMILGVISYLLFSLKKGDFFRKGFPLLLLIVVLILLGVFAFNKNLFGIQNLYENSYLYQRVEMENAVNVNNDARFDRKLKYLQLAPHYLFGGNHIKDDNMIGYAHELWLDIYDDAGIFAYIAIIIFTISSIKHFVKAIKKKETSLGYKVALLSMLIILLGQFFVEPILNGAPMLFYSFILIDGMITAYLNNLHNDNQRICT